MKKYFEMIKAGKTVKFVEFSENSTLSHNGGVYHIYTVVKPIGNGNFKVSTKSSCDFVDDTEEFTISISGLRKMLHSISKHPYGWEAEIK